MINNSFALTNKLMKHLIFSERIKNFMTKLTKISKLALTSKKITIFMMITIREVSLIYLTKERSPEIAIPKNK